MGPVGGEVRAVRAEWFTGSPENQLRVALSAVAAVSLGQAVQDADGQLTPAGIGWLSVAVLAAMGALVAPPWHRFEPVVAQVEWLGLLGALAAQFAQLQLTAPGISMGTATDWERPFVGLLAVAAVVCGALVGPARRTRHLLIGAMLMAHFALGLVMLHASPAPHIDVFVFQRDSARALLAGADPYALEMPNIYGAAQGYGPEMLANGRLGFGFPYPPLSLELSTLGDWLGGDVRYADLAAMTVTGGLIAYLRPGPLPALAAALYLFTPRNFFVLEQSWTEPFVVLFVAAVVFCALRRPTGLPYALGLFLVSKQYCPLALPLVALLAVPGCGMRWYARVLGRAAAVAAVVTLPLAVLHPSAFVHSVGLLQFRLPFRPDSLSYTAWLAGPDGAAPFTVGVAFLAAVVVIGLALWRAPRTPSGFALALAATFLIFFAFNKQSFCNYYFLAIGCLCVAIAASRPTPDRTPTRDRTAREDDVTTPA
jgi:hypothetical protein